MRGSFAALICPDFLSLVIGHSVLLGILSIFSLVHERICNVILPMLTRHINVWVCFVLTNFCCFDVVATVFSRFVHTTFMVKLVLFTGWIIFISNESEFLSDFRVTDKSYQIGVVMLSTTLLVRAHDLLF